MAEQAKVTSLDALEFFRQRLLVFQSKAQRVLDDVRDEVKRTRFWVQNDQWRHWEHQIKKRRQLLELAEAELMTARMSEFIESPTIQQQAVRRARASVLEAEEKLRHVKHWSLEFDRRSDPHVRRLEQLRSWLDDEVPKATAYLWNAQRTLEAYASDSPPAPTPPPHTPPTLESTL
jgi:hypothetical protein